MKYLEFVGEKVKDLLGDRKVEKVTVSTINSPMLKSLNFIYENNPRYRVPPKQLLLVQSSIPIFFQFSRKIVFWRFISNLQN